MTFEVKEEVREVIEGSVVPKVGESRPEEEPAEVKEEVWNLKNGCDCLFYETVRLDS